MENPFELLDQKLDLILEILQNQTTAKGKEKEWGGVDFASEITGYSVSTIYIKTSRNEMPSIKRDGRLWFNRSTLVSWIASGKIEKLDKKKS